MYEIVTRVLDVKASDEPPAELLEKLVGMATAYDDECTLQAALVKIGRPREGKYAAWQLTSLAGLLDALERREASWEKYDPDRALGKMFEFARATVQDDAAPEEQRLVAVRLVGRSAALSRPLAPPSGKSGCGASPAREDRSAGDWQSSRC